ncbi:NmrA/HSCARG family protein (plasmid) [Paraburkholderia sp. PREW-6R]|uniref:NmrA/HSCARG family protein n=1 Tax=Paraburkholderia sp. PREW-6R TaxID=3141544 RepID=UPI0031F517A8
MTILVTGSTGTIGTHLINHLAGEGVAIHALTRDPNKAKFPDGVVPVRGDMLDVEAMRNALSEVTTLFLLNAVTPQELSEALLTLNLAREAGIQRVVYFSVFNGQSFTSVPHFAAKYSVEQMIEQYDIPATILRPNCFMQNDALFFKDALLGAGIYPFPIGEKGVSMVDARDVAQVAARALVDRERATDPLPHQIINVVGPQALTGTSIAAIWSELLGKTVKYAGDDTSPLEKQIGQHAPGWMAMDLRLMLDRFVQDGMRATSSDVAEMARLLGRPPRSYAEFAAEAIAQWRS